MSFNTYLIVANGIVYLLYKFAYYQNQSYLMSRNNIYVLSFEFN